MKLQIMFLALTLPLAVANAQDTGEAQLNSYHQRVIVAEDGSAEISIEAQVTDRAGDSLLIPLNCTKEIADLQVVDSVASLERISRGGVDFVKVEAVQGRLPESIVITFRVPDYLSWQEAGPKNFGNFELSYRFTNASFAMIPDVKGEVVLPQSFVVHAIVESIPRVSKNDPVTSYTVTKYEDKHAISIEGKDLSFGASLFVKFNARKQEKSPIMLIFFLILAVGYLIFFTDALKEEVNGG